MIHIIGAARAARLRYVHDTAPGIYRKRAGRSFAYYSPSGEHITDRREIERIRKLGIPPAWTDVWICPNPNGHLQATGRDAKRRKQYRYHPRWASVRAETKYQRSIAFGEALPRIRASSMTSRCQACHARRRSPPSASATKSTRARTNPTA